MLSFVHNAEVGVKIEELHNQQNLSDESAAESAMNTGVVRNLMSEDDLKASYGLDTPVCFISLVCACATSLITSGSDRLIVYFVFSVVFFFIYFLVIGENE